MSYKFLQHVLIEDQLEVCDTTSVLDLSEDARLDQSGCDDLLRLFILLVPCLILLLVDYLWQAEFRQSEVWWIGPKVALRGLKKACFESNEKLYLGNAKDLIYYIEEFDLEDFIPVA